VKSHYSGASRTWLRVSAIAPSLPSDGKKKRVPIARDLARADAEEPAEVDNSGVDLSVPADDDVYDPPHVLAGAAANILAENGADLLRRAPSPARRCGDREAVAEAGGIALNALSASSGSSDVNQLVQPMAGFDGSGAAGDLNTVPTTADTSQQQFLTMPQHACDRGGRRPRCRRCILSDACSSQGFDEANRSRRPQGK
jgi:hypothetical protein